MPQQQLRQQQLNARAKLSDAQRKSAAQHVGQHLLALPELQQPSIIASYHSVKAELPTATLNAQILAQGHRLALPILHPFRRGHLLFLEVHDNTQWTTNRYGIPEPCLTVQDVVPLHQLQIMLVPLVAFDSQGNRLGMGGGYYDRTLQWWYQGRLNVLPIGLAYNEQYVEKLPAQPWDVPLAMVITPAKVWDFRG